MSTKAHVERLAQASNPFFIGRRFRKADNADANVWDAFWNERALVGPCITATLQTDSAFQDCLIARKLIKVAKTKRKTFLQSSLLRFYWHSFQHHSYIFHEKIGLLKKEAKKLAQASGEQDLFEALEELHKRATRVLHPLKRARGEIVHGWTREHPAVYRLGMVELLTDDEEAVRKMPGLSDLVGHSKDAAYDMRHEIKAWEQKLALINTEVVTRTIDLLLPQIEQHNRRYAEKIMVIG